jgi:TetR/AcrR family transcriptional regulator, fatty acid metabolism regulator protein
VTGTYKLSTKRQQQAEATKQRILATARRLVREHGFDNVSVETICKASGVAKGGFYHHFSSKDDIVHATYGLIDERFLKAMETLPRRAAPRHKIEFTTDFMAVEAVGHGVGVCRQIYRSQLERGTEFFISPQRPFYALIHEALQEAATRGEIRSALTTEEQTRLVLSLTRGIIYDWSLHAGSYDLAAFMNRAVSACLDGLFLSS